jgi:hypothetical protein
MQPTPKVQIHKISVSPESSAKTNNCVRPVRMRAALEVAELSTEKHETQMSKLFGTHLKNNYYIKSESFSARNESVGLPW